MKLDDKIRQLVTTGEAEIPAALRRSVRRTIHSRLQTRPTPLRRRLILSALTAGLVLASVLVLINPPAPRTPRLSEIRTEFYLPEKNIKVIWIQKKNFKLRRTNP